MPAGGSVTGAIDEGTGLHHLAFPFILSFEESKAGFPREEGLVSGQSILSLFQDGLVTDGLAFKVVPCLQPKERVG